MLRSILVLCLSILLAGCSAPNGDKYHTLRVEFRMLAEAATELMEDEIKADPEWNGKISDLLAKVQNDEYWNKKLSDGTLMTSGGKDVWGNLVKVYRSNDGNTKVVIVESGGPDGNLDTANDNVSAQFYLPE